MRSLYGFFIFLYSFSARITALFNPKARSWVDGRRDIFLHLERSLKEKDPQNNRKRAWFHCASLGEFEQGRPVIEAYRIKHPDHLIVLTFFSPSGYEIRKNYPNADIIIYLPADTKSNAERFVRMVRPDAAVFVKYEFWYNYLHFLSLSGSKIFFISVILRPSQVFFRWYGGWFRKQLMKTDRFFVQDEDSVKLLESIGYRNAVISGDTRFDRVYEISHQPKELPVIEKFCGNDPVIVAGSTWPEDEKLILPVISEKKLKLIIAPHETDEARIRELISNINQPVAKYSEVKDGRDFHADILIIDSIGILSSLYRYAAVAYIGGGFGVGIHNILEAAAYGVPVIFGPNYQKFREARELVELGGALSINSENQLVRILDNLAETRRRGEICSDYVEKNQGATRCIMDYL